MREGGFTVVGRRQGRRRLSAKALAAQQAAAHPMPSEGMGDEASMSEALDKLDERLEGAVSELRVSPLWRRLLHLFESLRPIDHLISFGIGSFSLSPAPRYQMALLLLLREVLLREAFQGEIEGASPGASQQTEAANGATLPRPSKALPAAGDSPAVCDSRIIVYVYDPVFSTLERHWLGSRGFVVPEQNDEGQHATSARTLFWMPHCGRRLYSNLLGANWRQKSHIWIPPISPPFPPPFVLPFPLITPPLFISPFVTPPSCPQFDKQFHVAWECARAGELLLQVRGRAHGGAARAHGRVVCARARTAGHE